MYVQIFRQYGFFDVETGLEAELKLLQTGPGVAAGKVYGDRQDNWTVPMGGNTQPARECFKSCL